MNITDLAVHELQEKIKNKELTITEINEAYIKRIDEKEPEVQAFITELTEQGIEQANHLTQLLLETNRIEDLKKAISNPEYRKRLLEEMNL